MRNTVILIITLITAGAFASEELPPGETTPIGEVGGVTYLAMVHEPDPAGASFEIKTEKAGVYETKAELTVPAADSYYAGVSPDGKYYFVAGETGLVTFETDPKNFLYIYAFGKDEPVLGYTSDDYNTRGTRFARGEAIFTWEGGKLYYVVLPGPGGGLGAISYEADPQTGEVNARLPERSMSLPGDEKTGE
jgi:hypothetical protein